MYKKIFFSLLITCAICLCSACASKPSGGVNQDILDYQRDAAKLESTVEQYERAIGDCIRELESLRSRAESMEATVDGLIEVFGQYQQLVDTLIYNYNKLREQDSSAIQDTSSTAYNNSSSTTYNDNWIYFNVQGS